MTFVAELDLATLDPSFWPGPRSGVLSFFAAVSPEGLSIDSGGETPTGVPFGLDEPDEDHLEAYLELRTSLLGVEPHHLLLGCPFADDDGDDDPDEASRLWPSLHAEAVGHGLSTDEPPPGEPCLKTALHEGLAARCWWRLVRPI